MSLEERSLVQKSPEALMLQMEDASVYAQAILGQTLIPPSLDTPLGRDELVATEYEQLNAQYRARMDIYGAILTAQATRTDISDEERRMFSTRLQVLNNLDHYIAHHRGSEDDQTLYDRQFTVFEDLRDFLEEGNTQGYIKLPTGSGKTVLFTEFAEAVGLRTLIVTPTRLLVEQTEEKFGEFASGVEVGKVYSRSKDFDRQVTITTYASFLKGIAEGTINPDDYDLLVLDEAHKSLTKRRSEAVAQFDRAIKIGFTATPKYSPSRHVGNLLNTEIHSMGIREAIETGVLSSLSVYIAQTEVDLNDVKITRAGEFDERDLDRVINIESRNHAAVKLYKEMFEGQKGVAYCVSIQHAKDLADLFNREGILAGVVYGTQNPNEQREVLKKYKRGEISVICNADILIEGFDDPSASVCLNLRPTTSPVIAEQRAGRVLRIDRNNPSKHAYIVDFIDEVENSKSIPVSLAQIVEGAHIFREGSEPPPGYHPTGMGTPQYPFTQIDGLKVITQAEEVMRIVREIQGTVFPQAEDGWLTISGLHYRFRLSNPYIHKLIKPYRETHPEYFSQARSNTGKVLEFFSPELISEISNLNIQMQAPIEGWVSISQVANEIDSAPVTICKILDKLRVSHSMDIRIFKRANGHRIEHVSPELAARIIDELRVRDVPEGWISISEGAELFSMTEAALHSLLRKTTSPDDQNICTLRTSEDRRRKAKKYLSPTLLGRLEAAIGILQPAPEGWETNSSLASSLKVSRKFVRDLTEKYRETHPEFFNTYIGSRGGRYICEYYSPELTSYITDQISSLPQPPEGWITMATLADSMGISVNLVYDYLTELGNLGEEDIGNFRRKSGDGKVGRLTIRYISPHVTDLIEQTYHQTPIHEQGWTYANALCAELGLKFYEIKSFVNKYRKSHPWYFTIARGGPRRSVLEHFSPELVAEIRQHFGRRK